MTDKIYIILPVYNRREITRNFIHQLDQQCFRNFHLVLVDDGSTDGTSEMVAEHYPDATIIKGAGNWWWAGSLQQGFNWLKYRRLRPDTMVLIINDDTYFERDFLERAVGLLKQNSGRVLLAAQCYYSKTGRIQNAGIHVDWRRFTFEQATNQDKINCLTTRALLLRLSDFIEIGGFYPKLLPHYLSDYEFTIRAYGKGMRLRTEPALKLTINEDSTGYHNFDNDSFCQFQRKLFSRKSVVNPIAWILFLVLACPFHWKFINIFRILFYIFKLELKQMLIILKKKSFQYGRKTAGSK